MKYLSIVALYVLICSGSCCSAQIDHASDLLTNSETKNIIDDYPLDAEEIALSNPWFYRSPFGMQALQYCGIFLGYEYDVVDFEERVSRIEQTHRKLASFKKVRILPGEESLCEFDIVIPNRGEVALQSEDFLSEASEYFVFKVEEGRFAKNEYLNYESNCTDQKHGYSSGAVIDRTSNRIMHWMMVW